MLYPIQGARAARIVSDAIERSGEPGVVARRGFRLFTAGHALDLALLAAAVALGMLVLAG
jgi:hypothetical protein